MFVSTWLREVSSCSCLTVLPGPAWVLLSKKYILFLGALYSEKNYDVKDVLIKYQHFGGISYNSFLKFTLERLASHINAFGGRIHHKMTLLVA